MRAKQKFYWETAHIYINRFVYDEYGDMDRYTRG